MGEVKDVLNLVTNGGAIVLLALVGFGIYKIARELVPAMLTWLAEDTAAKAALVAKLGVVESKVDAQGKATAEAVSAAAAATTKALDATTAEVVRVRDAVAAEAFELSTRLDASEKRVTAAVRREQASDPPAPSSTATPARGLTPVPPRFSRVPGG